MHDELIAALKLAERELEGWATWHMLYTSADADKYRSAAERIRALIADLRAGNLVRREDVVAHERERCARVAEHEAEKDIFRAAARIAAAIRAGEQP